MHPELARAEPMHVVQLLPAMQNGGVERGTLEVARALVEAGHQATVISAGGTMVAALRDAGVTHLDWSIGRKHLRTLAWVGRLRRWLHENHVDIVHARSRLPAWIGFWAWQRLDPTQRPRFVTTVHGLNSVNRYSRIMTRGERVIAVSEAVRNHILSHYPHTDPSRICLIPRGVSATEFPHGFRPAAEWLTSFQTQYPELRDRWLISLPARLTRLKGHIDFFRIVSALAAEGLPVHGLVIGPPRHASDKYANELYRQVHEQALPVSFLGLRRDMRELYAVSDVVLSLSATPESFGRTVLESLSIGTPVVGYAHGGVSEILDAVFPAGKVAHGDWQTAAAQLTAFYKERPKVPAHHPYTLERMLDATLALYQKLAAERGTMG